MSQHPLMTAHDALLQAIEAYNAETNDYNEVVFSSFAFTWSSSRSCVVSIRRV